MNALAEAIELYLLQRGDWVSTTEICARFSLRDDRPLRQVNEAPGLCTAFAISSDKGLKHVSKATTREWLRFKHRLRRHGISELQRVSRLDRRRRQVVTHSAVGIDWERDSGQAVMAF